MKILIAISIILLAATLGCAGTVTLQWDTYTDVADGIYCYMSAVSPVNPIPVNRIATVTPITQTTVTVQGLANGLKYFVCTAYAGTLESVPSNEASGVLRPNKPANVRIP